MFKKCNIEYNTIYVTINTRLYDKNAMIKKIVGIHKFKNNNNAKNHYDWSL